MSVEHRALRITHDYPHPRSRVFTAWADADIKRQWFTLSSRAGGLWRVDFRVGGNEAYRSPTGSTPRVTYDARYYDIVPQERIILATEVTLDGRRSSVTLNTAEFETTATGTRITITEQAAFLDGLETAESRAIGITTQLDDLETWLSSN